MKIIQKLKTFTRRTLIVAMIAVTGCGLFGANAPTERDAAVSLFNGMTQALEVLDAQVATFIETNDLTEEQLTKIEACVDRLYRVRDALVLAKNYIDNPNADFKSTLKFAAEEAKVLVVELRELGVKIPKVVDTAISVAIVYSSSG